MDAINFATESAFFGFLFTCTNLIRVWHFQFGVCGRFDDNNGLISEAPHLFDVLVCHISIRGHSSVKEIKPTPV